MLEIREERVGDLCYWHSPPWTDSGILHGFFDRGIDGRQLINGAPASVLPKPFCELTAALLHQVHGVEVIPGVITGERQCADGWFVEIDPTASTKSLFVIRTADCVPLLLVDRKCRRGAALHAGWRGTLAGILPSTIAMFLSEGSSPADLEVVIGPAAGVCCYEVGDDVVQLLTPWEERLTASFHQVRAERRYIALSALLSAQASSFGIGAAQLGMINRCTICDPRFFSYRREKALAGRQVSVLEGAVAYKKS